jgi:hypothetical protein
MNMMMKELSRVLDGKQSKGVCVGEQITSPVCVALGNENGIIVEICTN